MKSSKFHKKYGYTSPWGNYAQTKKMKDFLQKFSIASLPLNDTIEVSLSSSLNNLLIHLITDVQLESIDKKYRVRYLMANSTHRTSCRTYHRFNYLTIVRVCSRALRGKCRTADLGNSSRSILLSALPSFVQNFLRQLIFHSLGTWG